MLSVLKGMGSHPVSSITTIVQLKLVKHKNNTLHFYNDVMYMHGLATLRSILKCSIKLHMVPTFDLFIV